MLLFSAVALLLCLSTTSATLVLPTQGRHRALMLHVHRALQTLKQCDDSSEALLAANPNLQSAYDTLSNEVDAKESECPDDASSCEVDGSQLASQAAFIAACENTNGTVMMISFSVTCDGESQTLSVSYRNLADCVDASQCSEGAIEDYYEDYEEYYEACTVNVNVNIGGSAGSRPGMVATAAIVALASVVAAMW